MQKITKKLSVILMDDTGKTHRYRCHTWVLKTLLALLIVLPIITGLVTWFSFEAWQNMFFWRQEKVQLEQALNESNTKLRSLVHLQSLLTPTIQPALITQPTAPPAEDIELITKPEEIEVKNEPETPPEIVKKDIESYKKPLNDLRFRLDNLEAHIVEQDRLRINVNLFNADSSQILAGTLTFSLLYPDGTVQVLKTKDSTFRIRRYKKVINTLRLEAKTLENIADCQLIAEIHVGDTVTLRSYYPIKNQ